MNVIFGPDYRRPNSYQINLAGALEAEHVSVLFSDPHRRILPLCRDLRAMQGSIFHLHWPEAFFRTLSSRIPAFASVCPLDEMHYLADLSLALSSTDTRLVVTAHNLWPHRRSSARFARMAIRATAQKARAIIAHSDGAAKEVAEAWEVDPARITVIPHGDLSVVLGKLPARTEARAQLPVPDTLPLFLIFGVVEDYKGIDEVIEAWQRLRPAARLVVVGHGTTPRLAARFRALAGDSSLIHLFLDRRLPEEEFKLWLGAADGVIFNYKRSLTSGAASLARSLALPILIHQRASTIDLREPHPSVIRYATLDQDFAQGIDAVIRMGDARPGLDPAWIEHIAWPQVARDTIAVYEKVLSE